MASSTPSPASQQSTPSLPETILYWGVNDEKGESEICLKDSTTLSPTEISTLYKASHPQAWEDGDAEDTDLVLQYERQHRKAQHAKKAGRPIQASDLDVVYVDDHLVAVNKPPGVLTTPGLNQNNSVLDLVYKAFCNDLQGTNPDQMIVHRLDMDTSGLVVFGRNRRATQLLHAIFRDRVVTKEYQALVMGHWPNSTPPLGRVDLPLQRDHAHPPFMRVATPSSERQATAAVEGLQKAGWKKLVRRAPKPSATRFQVVARGWGPRGEGEHDPLPFTHVCLSPITGRTHQLRVHCAALGYPILGDPTYSYGGEAAPGGGLTRVPHLVVTKGRNADATVPNEKMKESNTDTSSTMPSTSVVADDGIQQQWNKLYVPNEKPMCLHATRLSFPHPIQPDKLMEFHVPPNFEYLMSSMPSS